VRRFDHVLMGNGSGDGEVYEVFDPPWWKLLRWLSWWFLFRGRARGVLTILISGKPRNVRCRQVPRVIPHPITYPTSRSFYRSPDDT
jgi:hypothetical protein